MEDAVGSENEKEEGDHCKLNIRVIVYDVLIHLKTVFFALSYLERALATTARLVLSVGACLICTVTL